MPSAERFLRRVSPVVTSLNPHIPIHRLGDDGQRNGRLHGHVVAVERAVGGATRVAVLIPAKKKGKGSGPIENWVALSAIQRGVDEPGLRRIGATPIPRR